MKKLLAVFTALFSLLLLSGCSSEHTDAKGFQDAINSGAIVIDVRTAEEFNQGHIANAINLDVESGQFAAALPGLSPSASYALYCHSGRRSAIALDQMKQAGFASVVDLSGGIASWTAAGLPLE